MDDTDTTDQILLCSSCATEAGLADDAHSIPPLNGAGSLACEHCGATIAGFAYRVPATAYSGMAPGAG